MFFDIFKPKKPKSARERYEEMLGLIAEERMTVQQFVDKNAKWPLYHTVPVIETKEGKPCPNVLMYEENGVPYMPVFFSADALVKHYESNGLVPGVIIKDDLEGVLSALDSVPEIRSWGVVIDPDAEDKALAIPPRVRVRPKCLRD